MPALAARLRAFGRSLSARRHAWRHRRAERWQRPFASSWDRHAAWLSLIYGEHGFYRLVRANFHRVGEGLWRSAQPGPHQIRRWVRRHGIRTFVNLRNPGEYGSWALERATCAELGVGFVQYRMRSRGLPTREELLEFGTFVAGLEKPVLAHCKSGADRAGLFAALYLIVHERRSAAEALAQMSLRYGHLRFARAGMIDAFLEAWRDEGEARGMTFEQWVRDHYDPAAIAGGFRATFWSSLLADRIMKRE